MMAALTNDTVLNVASEQLTTKPSSSSTSSISAHNDAPKSEASFKDFVRIFTYVDRPGWILNIVAFIAAIGAGTALPLMDLVFGKFVTQFTAFALGTLSPEGYRAEVRKYTLYFIYLFVGRFALTYLNAVCISMAAIRTTKALRIDFLKHVLRQEISYFEGEDAASVAVQTTTNGNSVNNGVSEKLTLVIAAISTFVTAFIVALVVQWKLALITIAIVPTIILVTIVCTGIESKNEDQIQTVYSKAGHLAEEVFATMRTVHSFWLRPVMSKKYAAYMTEAAQLGYKKAPNYMVLFAVEFFCTTSAYGLAFWQGVRMYARGEITESGDVVTVIFAVVVAATSMSTIGPHLLVFTKATSAAAELFRAIDRPSNIDSMSEEGEKPVCNGEIEVRNVHFAYPARKDTKVLDGFSLRMPAGKTTALVGASGSGKSTIIGLLERWYDMSDEGQIFVDGVEIRDLNITWLRNNIRLVQQEPVLFSGSVFDNVAHGLMGTEQASLPVEARLKLVEDACKAAYADEFVERLPNGYETQVGERAMMLSGGQKQRLAIARSIISNPKVLLLDEATSALDPKAEKIVQEALNNVSQGRTTLIIAHKLSTVKDADNIAVVSAGKIIEQGTHDELLAAGGGYAKLVQAQDLGGTSEDKEGQDAADGHKVMLTRTETQAVSVRSILKKDGKSKKERVGMMRCLWIVLKEQPNLWLDFGITSIACILGGLTYPAIAIIFARSFNAFQITDSAEQIEQGDFYALMFFVIAVSYLILYGVIGWFSVYVSVKSSDRYRNELFDRTLQQDMDFFDDADNGTGSIVSRLTTYPNNILELVGTNVFIIMLGVVNVISSSILAIAVGWKLGLVIVLGALPVMLFCGYLRIRLEFKLDDDTSNRFAHSAAVAAEAVAAIKTVSSLTLERHILQRFEDDLSNVAGKALKALIWTMFWYALTQSVNFLAMALGFWYGGQLISTGEYSNEQFFIVFISVIFSGEAAAQFFAYSTSITKAQTAINYILALRERPVQMKEHPSAPSSGMDDNEKDPDFPSTGPTAVDCQDLSFAYTSRSSTKVLNEINISITPGSFIAFVGASGCGKSTMISLLSRFYDPTTGQVLANLKNLTDLDPRKYRRGVALVQQEPVLYSGTIRENVLMGLDIPASTTDDKAPTDEDMDARIAKACEQSNISTFLSSLPQGLHTPLGPRGTQLSGGQRQRIALARALIRSPKLLLLDEATSALDTESERVVQAALDEARDGRTTVAVAHRLSTIKGADCIYVFRAGRVIECGTHTELLGKRGVYWEMVQGQSLERGV